MLALPYQILICTKFRETSWEIWICSLSFITWCHALKTKRLSHPVGEIAPWYNRRQLRHVGVSPSRWSLEESLETLSWSTCWQFSSWIEVGRVVGNAGYNKLITAPTYSAPSAFLVVLVVELFLWLWEEWSQSQGLIFLFPYFLLLNRFACNKTFTLMRSTTTTSKTWFFTVTESWMIVKSEQREMIITL